MEQWNEIVAFFEANAISILLALLILIAGYIIATILRWGIGAAINRTKFGSQAKTTGGNLGRSIGQAIFYIVLLFAAYLALSKLGLGDYLQPIEDLLNSITVFVPKLIGAGFIFFIGWVLASLAKGATESTLEALQVDRLATKAGMGNITGNKSDLARALGTLVFVLVIIPVAIGALDTLSVDAISTPLTNMLGSVLDFIPALLAASIVLALSIFIGNWASNVLQNLLPSFGFDNALRQVSAIDDGEPFRTPPSKIAGIAAFVVIVVIGLTAAVNILNIESLDDILTRVLEIGGYLVLAAIILVIGLFVSNFLRRMVAGMGNEFIATVFYVASIALFGFMALAQLDFGDNGGIVQTAFTAIMVAGAVAAGVGGAIAFGMGGREWAAGKLQSWWPSKKAPARKAPAKKSTTRRKTTKK